MNEKESRGASWQPEQCLKFGPVDASDRLVKAQTTSAINASSTGEFSFGLSPSAEVADYFGELCFSVIYEGKSSPLFTGSVTKAIPTHDGVTVQAIGAIQLHENIVTDMVVSGVTAPEMIYVLARGSGIRQERLKIDGLQSLSPEAFEVTVPVDGVGVGNATDFAGVEFLPESHEAIGDLSVRDALRAAFTASAYARASVTATMMLEAEELGLAAIDLALAWLAAQLRYGIAELPRGNPVPFDRQESLSQPRRRRFVSVRATTSGRHWLRCPEMASRERSVSLSSAFRPLETVLPDLTLQEKLAFLALRRAALEPDLLARVHSLWEAIEFYCSGISVNSLFSASQLDAITRSLPELEPIQKQRAVDMIAQLNSPPLVTRLKKAIENDSVPVTDGEIDLLRRLRKLRNEVVHGRNSQLPIKEDVEYATSVVARLLMYRVAGLPKE